ncbi:MAG: glycosyl hydrolase family 18 protein [Defluviitaleaceae bacterium]|nr:glycosyl hydrolase family 18 protein [Defluviitaleaceae bacterium]
MKPTHLKKLLINTIITLLLLFGVAVLFLRVVMPYVREAFGGLGRGNVIVEFHEHYSLDASVPQLIFDSQWLRREAVPIVELGGTEPQVYLAVSFVKNNIDPFIFWDEYAEALFISTLSDMLEFSLDSEFYLHNGVYKPLATPVFERNGELYMAASLLQTLYPLIVRLEQANNIVIVTSADEPQTMARISSQNAAVHYGAASRQITARLNEGDEIVVFPGEFDNSENEDNRDYVRVRTMDGLLGYMHYTNIRDLDTAPPLQGIEREWLLGDYINNGVHHAKIWQGDMPINVTWEAVYHVDANASLMQTPLHSSLTAVAPMWFRINEDGTGLDSVASKAYVDWAHSQGVLVWPMVFDVWYTQSRLMLTSREARRAVIEQLVAFAEAYELDGINIDFEHLSAAEGLYKIQFLRELAIPMRQRGIVLSAAVKVPIAATDFYRRDLIAKTVDFVMVMAYDEHWATSPDAGPNASLPFVLRGVENMLLEVPQDRLILGVPFYNRVWRTVPATGEVTHFRAIGTNTTRAFFEEHGGTWQWDEINGVYFGEASAYHEGESVVFQVWLEDARSMQEKINIFSGYNLAGVASWNRMFAIDEFWEILAKYF